ncbi:hypothetical protein YC2023_007044 [Brassica napus]
METERFEPFVTSKEVKPRVSQTNENEFLFDLNQTPTDEEVDTLDNEEEEEDDDDDDALVNSHVYASDLFTETDQEPGYCEDGNFGIRLENVLVVNDAETYVAQKLHRTSGTGIGIGTL